MSGVYERNRDMSRFQWVYDARQIRHEVDRLARSEKVIPKSLRFSHGLRLCDHAARLVECCRKAYDRYPSTARLVLERKHWMQEAIDECWMIVEDLQNLRDEGFPVDLNMFDRVAGLLDEEITLLAKWRNNTKLTGKAPIEERMALKEAEIDDLRALAEEQQNSFEVTG